MDWDYFFTGTTGYELSLKSARRLLDRYARNLGQFGSGRIFWAAEPFDLKEGYHVHGLLELSSEIVDYRQLVEVWQVVTGAWKRRNKGGWTKDSWNRIDMQAYDPKRGAAGYLSKYITKYLADYDMEIM